MSFVEFDQMSLGEKLARDGFSASHAPKLLRAFYGGAGQIDFDELNLGPRVETWASRHCQTRVGEISNRIQSSDGTIKLLIRFRDGGAAESVLMPSYRPNRAACCVSSQIGCAMGCDFCASTKGGFERNLTAAEIVEQFLYLKAEAMRLSRRLTSLVFMGMGETLLNYDNLIPAIRRIADPNMGGLGWRQVTVSTVGIVPGIDRLAAEDLNVHLALSLHASDDKTRARLVPANRRYPIAEIIAAAKRFADKSGRIPTIEYCLLADVNDSDIHATELARLVHGFRAHVNLIPYNSIGPGLSGTVYERPSKERIERFLALLRSSGVVTHIRDTRGDDVSAACGQLRRMASQ